MTLPGGFAKIEPLHRRVLTRAVPLEVYDRLYADEPYAFLYESLEAHGSAGRYSFLGGKPRLVFRSKRDRIEIETGGQRVTVTGDPVRMLRELLSVQSDAPPVASFPGGAVGYFAYDTVRFFESIPDDNPDELEHPDAYFLFPEEIIILDHLNEVGHILIYAPSDAAGRADRIAGVLSDLDGEQADAVAAGMAEVEDTLPDPPPMRSNMSPEAFQAAVARAKEYILAGDVFQVVLSQRFCFDVPCEPVKLYKALRVTNPSPYMYFLKLDRLSVLGSSPEVLVKCTGRRASTRPLAGTRPRGTDAAEDEALERELLADEKERAEHVMLVDLSRNDLGRVCRAGSVRVTELLGVERYARVMHLVSNVEGRLREGCDAFDLLAASFPAGTVSGAPKIRAMEIIDELEPSRRGIYAGAIGYFSFLGDMDVCIAIRTIVVNGDTGYIQSGAGIVADSDPRREYQETLNKAVALMRAVRLATVRAGQAAGGVS